VIMDRVVKREKGEPMETASWEREEIMKSTEVDDVILTNLYRSPNPKSRPSSSTVKLQSLSVSVCVFVITVLFHNLAVALVHC
jgi:hypothetical protein